MRITADSEVIREQHIEIVIPYDEIVMDVTAVVVHVHMPSGSNGKPESKTVKFYPNWG